MTVRRHGLSLGGVRSLDGSGETRAYELPADDLITHGVVVGGTGSGKTGLLVVMVEEAVLSRIPTILVDVKGDLPNLLLTFPELSAEQFTPWIDAQTVRQRGVPLDAAAEQLAADWRKKLAAWGRGPDDVAALKEAMAARVFTPGSQACEPLNVLSALERVSPLWETDVELARESLSATISLLLRLLGRNPDPTKSRDHVVLSIFAERRLRSGVAADVRWRRRICEPDAAPGRENRRTSTASLGADQRHQRPVGGRLAFEHWYRAGDALWCRVRKLRIPVKGVANSAHVTLQVK